jgi:hypothetical protein
MTMSKTLFSALVLGGILALSGSALADDTPAKPAKAEKTGDCATNCEDSAKDASCDSASTDCAENLDCAKCEEGAKVKGSCCEAKIAKKNLRTLASALVDESAKVADLVMKAVPEKSREAVQKASDESKVVLAKVEKAMGELKADLKAAAEAAKEEGEELGCSAETLYKNDCAALKKKANEALDSLGTTVKSVLAEEKIVALADSVRQAREAAAKAVEKAKVLLKTKPAKAPADAGAGTDGDSSEPST